MRILSAESLADMIAKYSTAKREDHYVGNIVLSNSEKRRQLRSYLLFNTAVDKFRMSGLVMSFKSGSMIRLSISAERPGAIMFDDILVDAEIGDMELLMLLARAERLKDDFGEIELSNEIAEYIGGILCIV